MNSTAPTVPSPPDNSEQEQLLEQYKTYLDTIDHFAEKRLNLHTFFLTINSSLAALFGYMLTSSEKVPIEKWSVVLLFVIAIVGFSFSRVWYLLVTSYTTLNSVKWDVIYDMEKKLPYHPFQSEWENNLENYEKQTKMPKGPLWLLPSKQRRPYYSTSSVERELPRLFGWLYLILGLGTGPLTIWNIWGWLCLKVPYFKELRNLGLDWAGIVILVILALALVVFGRIALALVRKWFGED